MTGDAKLFTGNPRWYIFLLGLSPLAFIFTGVETSGALSRDVEMDTQFPEYQRDICNDTRNSEKMSKNTL